MMPKPEALKKNKTDHNNQKVSVWQKKQPTKEKK